ncbi:type II secretion system protein [Moritella sp. Urea-trap-13]|uniref:type II secretion system protein n=1 Tax=Moritella sp. Urea-trap-13 TaxID=2058327 RepID=UPI000C336A5E|nr:type II secretion system protein [Moritella sp. Urea-trap-13]PKH05495.1 MSHA biogenesis protein MshA [Moritella sp. Urea-trap-13]
MRHRSNGFTLIELVIVIVILGILAATASSKIFNLSADARIATLESLEGAILSASSMVNYKAVIEKKTDCSTDPTIEMQGETITLRCGYPCPHPNGIGHTVETGDAFSWVGGNCGGVLGYVEVQVKDAPTPSTCKIRYSASDGSRPPIISLTDSGC